MKGIIIFITLFALSFLACFIASISPIDGYKEFVESQRNYIKSLEQKLEKDKFGFRYTTFVYAGLIGGCIFILKESILGWIEIISWF